VDSERSGSEFLLEGTGSPMDRSLKNYSDPCPESNLREILTAPTQDPEVYQGRDRLGSLLSACLETLRVLKSFYFILFFFLWWKLL
jgi:hypothetical protein